MLEKLFLFNVKKAEAIEETNIAYRTVFLRSKRKAPKQNVQSRQKKGIFFKTVFMTTEILNIYVANYIRNIHM